MPSGDNTDPIRTRVNDTMLRICEEVDHILDEGSAQSRERLTVQIFTKLMPMAFDNKDTGDDELRNALEQIMAKATATEQQNSEQDDGV